MTCTYKDYNMNIMKKAESFLPAFMFYMVV